jgi:hypothetical protein
MTHCDKSLPFTKISWDLSFSKHTSTGLDKNNPLKNHLLIKKGGVWAHKTSLTPPTFIEVSVPSEESERSCK